MTTMTMSAASARVLATSKIEARMNCGRIIGDRRLQPGRQLALNVGHGGANAVDDRQRIGLGRSVDADEHRLQPVEDRRTVRAFGAQFDLGDIAEADQRVAARRRPRAGRRPAALSSEVSALTLTCV